MDSLMRMSLDGHPRPGSYSTGTLDGCDELGISELDTTRGLRNARNMDWCCEYKLGYLFRNFIILSA